jgi:hypothetical protein
MLGPEWLGKEWVVHQVDLTDRTVIGSPPVSVESLQLAVLERSSGHAEH